MDIDINMRGAEAVASKASRLSRSMTGLESAWSKYSRASRSGRIGGGMLSGVGRTAASAMGGSVIGGAVAFLAIERVISSLMGDQIREITKQLIASGVNGVKSIMSDIAFLMRETPFGIKLAGSGLGKSVVATSKWTANIAQKIITGISRAVPMLVIAAAASTVLLLDARIAEWASKTVKAILAGVNSAVTTTAEVIGTLWGGFKTGLAKATNNPFYATSQVNRGEAAKQLTPEQQTKYMRSEKERLASENMSLLIKRTEDELKTIFRTANEKTNMDIRGIQELMIASGRL